MLSKKSGAVRAAALFAGAALALTACGGGGDGGGGSGATGKLFDDCDTKPNTCNSVERAKLKDGGVIRYASEKWIDNWNVLSSDGNVQDYSFILKGTQTYTFITKPDLSIAMNKDLLVSAEQTEASPQTIVYKIREEAKWSDGTPITAKDFRYNWKVQNGADCPDCAPASTAGYDRIESVEGSDNGKTVTVTFSKPFTDWQQLWGSGSPIYPAHIAAKHGDLSTPEGLAKSFEWFGKNPPTWSAGPFKVGKTVDQESVTLVPNKNYWGQKTKLDKVIFRVIQKATNEPSALKNGEVQVIAPQPQVDLVNRVKQIPDVSSYVAFGLSWEHFDLNLKNKFLADETLRDAMFTAVDRKAIINKTVGQFAEKAKPLNSHMFMPQKKGYKDVVTQTGHGSGNVKKAKKILTDAGYQIKGGKLITPDGETVPPLTIRYTAGNKLRQSEVELFQSQVKPLGIDIKISPTKTLGKTLTSGDYDIAVFAWISSGFPRAGAVQLWSSTSESNFGQYKNEKVDKLLAQASAETDKSAATKKLQQADKIIAEDAYVLPLYQKPTFVAVNNQVANVRNNPSLDGVVYNIGEWGLRTE